MAKDDESVLIVVTDVDMFLNATTADAVIVRIRTETGMRLLEAPLGPAEQLIRALRQAVDTAREARQAHGSPPGVLPANEPLRPRKLGISFPAEGDDVWLTADCPNGRSSSWQLPIDAAGQFATDLLEKIAEVRAQPKGRMN